MHLGPHRLTGQAVTLTTYGKPMGATLLIVGIMKASSPNNVRNAKGGTHQWLSRE